MAPIPALLPSGLRLSPAAPGPWLVLPGKPHQTLICGRGRRHILSTNRRHRGRRWKAIHQSIPRFRCWPCLPHRRAVRVTAALLSMQQRLLACWALITCWWCSPEAESGEAMGERSDHRLPVKGIGNLIHTPRACWAAHPQSEDHERRSSSNFSSPPTRAP